MSSPSPSSSGGSAGAAGHSFAARVGAFFAVDILREKGWPARWDLPAHATLTAVAAETEHAVDDLELRTSDGGEVLLQIKRHATASSKVESDLSGAVDQFVREYLGIGRTSPHRPFDPGRDRMVLVCVSPSSRAIAQGLPAVLSRVRDDRPRSIEKLRLRNESERRAWGALLVALRRAWKTHAGRDASDDEIIDLLRVLHVEQLEVEEGERDERSALGWLRESVLVDPEQDRLAWTTLIEKLFRAAAYQSRAHRVRLQQILANVGVKLRVSPARQANGLFPALTAGSGASWKSLQDFLRTYLSTETQQVTFGGRDAELDALDQWLSDADHPFALLVADAGRGKSALLTHWAVRIAESDLGDVVFVPISNRFGTSLQHNAMGLLYDRLRYLRGDGGRAADPSAWGTEVALYLAEDRPANAPPLIVVIDGVDEAAGWQPARQLPLPAAPGKGIKVVVSARRLIDVEASTWARKFTWDERALKMSLPPLKPSAIAEMLTTRLGKSVTGLDELALTLYGLTEGDPLAASLYIEALGPGGFIDLRQVSGAVKKGLYYYFEEWWQAQAAQWKAEGRDPVQESEHASRVLNVLALAFGPLRRQDIGEISGIRSGTTLDTIMRIVDRWIVSVAADAASAEHEFIFSHPRLAEYFVDRMLPAEQITVQRRFVEFCRAEVARLTGGASASSLAGYAVRHYGNHLDKIDASLAEITALTTPAWRESWEVFGDEAGFLSDVSRAWRKADDLLSGMSTPADTRGRAVALQCRCLLIVSSLASSTPAVPFWLIGMLLSQRSQRWPASWALEQAEKDPSAEALATVVPYLPAPLVPEAVGVATAIQSEMWRTRALLALAPVLTDTLPRPVLVAVRTLTNERWRADVLAALARFVPAGSLDAILSASMTIESPVDRARVLAALSSRSDDYEFRAAVQGELRVGSFIADEDSRAAWLATLAPAIPDDLIADAVSIAESARDPRSRAIALAGMAPRLDPASRLAALNEVRSSAMSLPPGPGRAQVVRRLLRVMPECDAERVLHGELALLKDVKDESQRARALALMAEVSPVSCVRDILAEAGQFVGQQWCGMVAAALAKRVPRDLVSEFLATTQRVGLERADILVGLSADNRTTYAAELLVIASETPDSWGRMRILTGLAGCLPDELVEQARHLAEGINDPAWRIRALGTVIPKMAPDERQEVLHAALAWARRIGDVADFDAVLRDVALGLGERLIEAAMDAAFAIGDAGMKHAVLAALAPQMPEGLAVEAIGLLRRTQPDWYESDLLRALLPRLDNAGRTKLVTDAVRSLTQRGSDNIAVLAALATHLSEAEGLPLFQDCLRIIERLRDDTAKGAALAELGMTLPARLIDAALDIASGIVSNTDRIAAVAALLPRARKKRRSRELGTCLHVALAIRDEGHRAMCLQSLAPVLHGRALTQALRSLAAISDERIRAGELVAFFRRNDGPYGAVALQAAESIGDEAARTQVLAELLPRVDAALTERAYGAAIALHSAGARARALVAVTPTLDSALIEAAAEEVWKLGEYAQGQATVMSALAPKLSSSAVFDVLERIQAVRDDNARLDMLVAVAPKLGERRRAAISEELRRARGSADETRYAFIVARLGEWLPDTEVISAVKVTSRTSSDVRRGEIWSMIAPRFAELVEQALFQAWSQALHTAAGRKRRTVLGELRALLPVLRAVGGEATLALLSNVIRELAEWLQ